MEHVDEDGDRNVFCIEGGALNWYCNGELDTVVTKLTCSFKRRTGLFDLRDQTDSGSSDYPADVVRTLKEMATMAGVNLEGHGWSRANEIDANFLSEQRGGL